MSYNYCLICMDCKVGIDLGKTFNHVPTGSATKSFGFESVGGRTPEMNDNGDSGIYCMEFIDVLQLFLLKHRTHELRVLPESIQMYEEHLGGGVPNSWPSSDEYQDYLKQDLDPPDPVLEAQSLDDGVIAKLKNF